MSATAARVGGTVQRMQHSPPVVRELETDGLLAESAAAAAAGSSASADASSSSASSSSSGGSGGTKGDDDDATAISVPATKDAAGGGGGGGGGGASGDAAGAGAAAAGAGAAAPASGGSGGGAATTTLSSTPYIAFWIAMSMSVILFNKFLYSGVFPFPLTLTCLHMAFAALLTQSLRAAGRLEVPAFGWPLYARAVLPIGALFACSLGLSNVAVMRLSVPFVQMCKALTPMVTLAVSVLMGLEQPTTPLAIVVSLMSAGVVLSTLGEISFELVGFACQLGSIVSEASRLVVMQALLQEHLPPAASKNPLVSLSLFTPSSCLFLLPVAVYYEPRALRVLLSGAGVYLPVALNTVTAFSLNIAVVMLVGATSGLTLTLAGIIKDILLIVSSLFLFGAPITRLQVLGYLVALYGLNCFNLYKAAGGKVETAALFREGATNKVMAGYAAGMIVLSFFARAGK
jgi:hypothetical protein